MYRIGEFAELTNLSVRTLRFYNEEGLLIPEEVDTFSNYRYYSDRNLEEANMINNLKLAGFSLDEIKESMGNLTDERLLSKKQELYDKIFCIEEQIKRVDSLMECLPNEHVKVKTLGGHNEREYSRNTR
ncbi:MAG: MerR family transcriptional regulator [Bacilli bacterium]|nr:MerR family transcriptional regulator [Bacilli bacterium]